MRRIFAIALGLASGLLTCVLAQPQRAAAAGTLERANMALQAGEADKALTILEGLPQAGTEGAKAQNLACRIEFTMGQWDAAIRACEQAIHLDPDNSDDHLWLGRALGEKADRASFLNAFTLAKRVLVEFQSATQLDPRNGEALSDLGEFYVEAPAIVGGGLQKAESVAEELDRVDPVRAASLRAAIANARGDHDTAEDYLKQALAVSHHPAREWATLARYYAKNGRWAEMESAVRECETAAVRDPRGAVGLYDAAGVLIRVKRDPETAVKLLKEYLASPYKTEEAPAFVAYARLAQLQQKMGDSANAQLAMDSAYQLAHEYQPAVDARR